jgi:hypothetical protein
MRITFSSNCVNPKFVILILFLILLPLQLFLTQEPAYSQKADQELAQQAQKYKQKYLMEYQNAVERALEMGWPVREEYQDGTIIEIQRLAENGMPVYYITHNLNAARTVSTDDVWPGGSAGLNLSGSGMTIGEWDGGGVRTTHQELTGRATQMDGVITPNWHSTHVAGTLIGSGAYSPAQGMSYQAQLDAYDWNGDNTEMLTAAGNGLLISNHSYGYTRGWYFTGAVWYWYGTASVSVTEDYSFGFYDGNSQTWDDIAFNRPYYLIVKSAGNDRDDTGPGPSGGHYYWNGGWVWSTTTRDPDGGASGYDCIGTQGVAKNILTVGAVDDIPAGYSAPADVVMSLFSSWGPADDGRIKPDIVANGVGLTSAHSASDASYATAGGTSMSSPSAAGSLLLLQQHFQNLNDNDSMRSATLKGLVIHTADEAGSNDGPDYTFGWGLLNTEKSAAVITNNGNENHILEQDLTDGGNFTKLVYSEGLTPLTTTICWTDPPGTPPSASLDPTTPMLVNDLDLRMTNGTTYFPWILDVNNPTNAATRADNTVDNVEKLNVDSPSRGLYTINITHKSTLQNGNQDYSLIISDAYNTLTHAIPSGDPAPQDFANMDIVMDFSSSPGGDVTVAMIPNSPPNVGGATIPKYWDIASTMPNGTFMSSLDFSYDAADVAGLSEMALVPVYYSDTESRWKRLLNYGIDTLNNTVTVSALDHFTIFAIGEMDAFNFVQAELKIFLDGPYNGSAMTTELYSNGYIPLSQPFSGSPWNYSGQETIAEMVLSTVDWILVELRTSIEPATTVTSRAALLQSDGTIIDLDGVSPLSFDDVAAGDYYIILHHRNHLSVMSSSVVTFSSGSSSIYDFTIGGGQFYGTGGAKDLGAGVWGMHGGEGNNSGIVTIADRNAALTERDAVGYNERDYNLSGIVTISDANLSLTNRDATTQVP